MAFNTWVFVAAFLPLTLFGFGLLTLTRRPTLVKLWLIAASLVFYGWGSPASIGLLGVSILVNYGLAVPLRRRSALTDARRKRLLFLGVAANLLLLGYFKYRNFVLEDLG